MNVKFLAKLKKTAIESPGLLAKIYGNDRLLHALVS